MTVHRRTTWFLSLSILSGILFLAITATTTAQAASGAAADLWQLSTPENTSEDTPAIRAESLHGETADRLADAAAPGFNFAEQYLVLQRQRALRQQEMALTVLNQSTGENETVLGKLERSTTFTNAAGHYDVYGVYRPAGYFIDESIVASGPNYFRYVQYQPAPAVIYTCPPRWHQPCYKPYPRRHCKPWGDPSLVIRATGDWGYARYRSNNGCFGPSLKVRINID